MKRLSLRAAACATLVLAAGLAGCVPAALVGGAVGAGAAAIPELCARTDPAATGRAGGGACGLGGTRRHSDALAADDDAQERAPR